MRSYCNLEPSRNMASIPVKEKSTSVVRMQESEEKCLAGSLFHAHEFFESASWLPEKMPGETFGKCDYHAGTLSGEPLYHFSWHRHEVGEKIRDRMQVFSVASDNA